MVRACGFAALPASVPGDRGRNQEGLTKSIREMKSFAITTPAQASGGGDTEIMADRGGWLLK